MSTLKVQTIQDLSAGSKATLKAGTAAVMNPVSSGGKVTQAHSLGAIPAFVEMYLECLSAEQGYSVGDRIQMNWIDSNTVTSGVAAVLDATNVVLLASQGTVLVALNKTTPNGVIALTLASWKLVAVPYILN